MCQLLCTNTASGFCSVLPGQEDPEAHKDREHRAPCNRENGRNLLKDADEVVADEDEDMRQWSEMEIMMRMKVV